MTTFALVYKMVDMQKNAANRPAHVAFLKTMQEAGRIETAWKFPDVQNGDIHSFMICHAASKDQVLGWFKDDPVVSSGARTIEVRDAEQGIFKK